MLTLTLQRTEHGPNYTLGQLWVDGEIFCHTLEPRCIDWCTEKKVMGKTAIPEGTYHIEWHWSQHFRRDMPYLVSVPHFIGIMIHPGNTVDDTQGCILVGRHIGNVRLWNSKNVFDRLMERIRNQEVRIKVM